LAIENEVYSKLAAQLGVPGAKRFIKVLEAMVTPEEAQLLLELPKPATVEELAARLKTGEASLRTKLEDMKERGLLNLVDQGYVSHRNVVMFHHSAHSLIPENLKPSIYPLWADFFWNEWRDILVDEFEYRLKTIGAKGHRVIPARKALSASPNIRPDQILWYEDMDEMIKRGKSIICSPCGCRVIWRKCESPVDI
jgi:hypothetical protein